MLLSRILVLLGAAAVASSRLHHYFVQHPKNSEVTKRLHGGFEYGIVGTGQLPVAILDGIYDKRTNTINGRMRWLPWVKRFMDDYLFDENFMNIKRLRLDVVIADVRAQYLPKQTDPNYDKLHFILFHFATRFLETFMEFERKLDAPVIKVASESSTINMDLLTQMYHFAYCEALSHIDRVEADLFNRCPNPCKSGRLHSTTTEKCPSGTRDCNPCLQVAEHLSDSNCTQNSRIWRRDFVCQCGSGYYWDKNTLNCRTDKDFFATLSTRNKLRISIDSLNIFADTKLPTIYAGFNSITGYKQFQLTTEARFHPFGHDAFSTLKTAHRMESNWWVHGIPTSNPDPIVSADLPHQVLVELVHTVYTPTYCTRSLHSTDYVYYEPEIVWYSPPGIELADCLRTCETSPSCKYVMVWHIKYSSRCYCRIKSLDFTQDGQPLVQDPNLMLKQFNKCPIGSGDTCSAFYKACIIYPPRILLSSLRGNDTKMIASEAAWSSADATEVCVNERNKIEMQTYQLRNSIFTGDYSTCLAACQRKCAHLMFLSAQRCYCMSGYGLKSLAGKSKAPCGKKCKHRPDWWCGGHLLAQGFVLTSALPMCAHSHHYTYKCVALNYSLRLRPDLFDDNIVKLKFMWQNVSAGVGTIDIMPWAYASSTRIHGPYWYNSAKLQGQAYDDDLFYPEWYLTPELIRTDHNSSRKCRAFCQLSCMRYFAMSLSFCYCTNKIELVAQTPLDAAYARCSGGDIVVSDAIPQGLDDESIALHDMGEMSLENCVISRSSKKSVIGDLPVSTISVLGSVKDTVSLKSTLDLAMNQLVGCFIIEEAYPLNSELVRAQSYEDCAEACALKCKQYLALSAPYCYCFDTPPVLHRSMIRATSLDSMCNGRIRDLSLIAETRWTSNGIPYAYLLFMTTDIQGYAGFGSTYSYQSVQKKLKYEGCHSFIGIRFGAGTQARIVMISKLVRLFDMRHHELCLQECIKQQCHSAGSCDIKFLICGPGACSIPYCLCMPAHESNLLRRMASRMCLENSDSLDSAVRNIRGGVVASHHVQWTHPNPSNRSIQVSTVLTPLQSEYDRDVDEFLQYNKYLAQEGGALLLMNISRFYFVYKTLHFTHCVLQASSLPRILTPHPPNDNCFKTINSVSKRVRDHSECVFHCRKQRQKLYTLYYNAPSKDLKCACFSNTAGLPAFSIRTCLRNNVKCHRQEEMSNCGTDYYSQVYQINLPLLHESVECFPRMLSQPGFYNLSILYECSNPLESVRSISLRPALFVSPSTINLSNMSGLFGLTKIDSHRGDIRIPVLTSQAKPSVKRLLQGLLQGEFESGVTLDLDSQVRARYASWDTWMRTVFYRTFNRTVNRCNLGRTTKLIVKSLLDDVHCECRIDFRGKHCTEHLSGCDSVTSTVLSHTIKIGNSACNVQTNLPIAERNVCFNAFNESDAPVVPFTAYSCNCRGNTQSDTSLPFENCLTEARPCRNVYCGEGICTDTVNGGWRCLCKVGRVLEKTGICSQRDPIYLFTAWSDWSHCEPHCGPVRYRISTRTCLLDSLESCRNATPDNEIQRRRVCRSRACRRHLSQEALNAYEELAGETLDLASGSLALIAVAIATSASCGLFLALVWIASPAMSRHLLEESLWFMLVSRNRIARTVNLPLLLAGQLRRWIRNRQLLAPASQAATPEETAAEMSAEFDEASDNNEAADESSSQADKSKTE